MTLRSFPNYVSFLRAAAGEPAGGGDPPVEQQEQEASQPGATEGEDASPVAGAEEQAENGEQQAEGAETDSTKLLPDNDVDPNAAAASLPDPNAWKDKEIRRKHAIVKQTKDQLAEAQRAIEEKDALIERLSRGEKPDPAAAPAPRPAALSPNDPAVKAAAQQIVDNQTYQQQLNEVNAKGEKDYAAKWSEALANLETIGPLDADTTAAAMATENPAKVLFELGSKPELYQELMELPPVKRLARMVKIADAPVPVKKVSGAPAPSNGPIQGRGPSDTNSLDDKVKDDEWFARRDKQVDAKFKGRSQSRHA